jgi:uncharacterized membrane protein YgdD (TMEM256/DUF423 family)
LNLGIVDPGPTRGAPFKGIVPRIASAYSPINPFSAFQLTEVTNMRKHPARFIVIGAIAAMLAVLLGAFGAHGLRNLVTPAELATYHTGVEYQFQAAFGLLVIGLLESRAGAAVGSPQEGGSALSWAGWLMLAGIVIFSGSLYGLALTGVRAIGMITPIGGVSFIAAWALLARAAWRTGNT